jgi:hypothetical protein
MLFVAGQIVEVLHRQLLEKPVQGTQEKRTWRKAKVVRNTDSYSNMVEVEFPDKTRGFYDRHSVKEWSHVAPLIRPAKHGGRKRKVDVREVVNGSRTTALMCETTALVWRRISASSSSCNAQAKRSRCSLATRLMFQILLRLI